MKKEKTGTGITQQTIYIAETPDDIRELEARGREYWRRWNADIEEAGSVFGGASSRAYRICHNTLKAAEGPPPYYQDSPEEYAQRVTQMISIAREMIEKGDADQAALEAWRAGVDWATACLKFAFEADVLARKRQLEAIPKAAKARKEKAAEEPPEWWDYAVQDAKELKRRNPKRSRTNISQELAKKYRYSARQIASVLKKSGIP